MTTATLGRQLKEKHDAAKMLVGKNSQLANDEKWAIETKISTDSLDQLGDETSFA